MPISVAGDLTGALDRSGHLLLRWIFPLRGALELADAMFSQLPGDFWVKEGRHAATVSPGFARRIGEAAGHLTGQVTGRPLRVTAGGRRIGRMSISLHERRDRQF
jgi:hypothetical protein